jgi:serine/threonine-protein kinase
VLAVSALAAPAAAQTNKVAAEALFDDAIKLMKDGKYDEACPKLADSQRLDPAANTLLNLAACYEKQGRTASAWETYKEAEAAERDAHHEQYMQLAHERAAALEPNLLKLTITATTKPVDGTVIKLDGTTVPISEWGTAVPVDPGQHTIEVSAPNKQSWSSTVTVGGTGAPNPATVDVPVLQDAPAAPPATTPQNTTTPATTTTTTATNPPAAPEQHGLSSQRVTAIVVGGLGIVGIAVGSVFGLVASSKNSDSKADCRPNDPNLCTSAGVTLRDDARTAGNISTVAFGVGAAALVGGIVLWATAPAHPRAATAHVDVVPTLGGAAVLGVF